MRITVTIPEDKVEAVLRLTGIPKKSPAIARAVDEYLDMAARQRFAAQILEKQIVYDVTNEEIENADKTREKALEKRRPRKRLKRGILDWISE